jgi:serine phosphatase RsbU (regulator of sigma subunit)
MRLIVLQNGAMVGELSCGEEAVYVGSRETCRVQLPDARVPDQLAVIYPLGKAGWVLQRLDPSHEIHVNGTNVPDRTELKTGDEIQVYDYLIRAFPEQEGKTLPRAGGATSVARLTRFVQYQLPPGTAIRKGTEELQVQPEQIRRLGEASLKFGQCLAVEELMDAALQALLETFAAQRVWIGVRRVTYGPMEYVEGRLLTGQTADLPEVGNSLKPRVLDRGHFVLIPRVSVEERLSVMAGPLPGSEGSLGMVYIDTGDSRRVFEARELDYLMLLLNFAAIHLDAIFQQMARNRAATVDGEVSVAHAIQARLTPRKLPQWEELQFGAFREQGREHTGDIYDVVRLSNKMAAFMVAHTSAPGPMPSMLIAQAQATFRSACMHLDAPHTFMRSLNYLLYDGQQDHPLDGFMGVIEPSTGKMRYAIAGRTGAYIIGQRGEERRLGPDEPTPSLGLNKNAAFALLPEQLESGENLVLYTPGVTTAKNLHDEVFGEDRFINLLCDGFGQLASSMLKEMLSDLRSFTEGGVQPNDITVLLAHCV